MNLARVTAVLAAAAVLLPGCSGRDTSVADRAATRSDRDTQAPIVVEAPRAGERVSNPLAVAGTASVFEATVHLRVLDARGRVVGHAWTTATSGAPERGDFSALISYDVDRTQRGTLEVFEPDAADPAEGDPDGRLSEVRIPVTLVAAFPGKGDRLTVTTGARSPPRSRRVRSNRGY